jgi:hypothetical protein
LTPVVIDCATGVEVPHEDVVVDKDVQPLEESQLDEVVPAKALCEDPVTDNDQKVGQEPELFEVEQSSVAVAEGPVEAVMGAVEETELPEAAGGQVSKEGEPLDTEVQSGSVEDIEQQLETQEVSWKEAEVESVEVNEPGGLDLANGDSEVVTQPEEIVTGVGVVDEPVVALEGGDSPSDESAAEQQEEPSEGDEQKEPTEVLSDEPEVMASAEVSKDKGEDVADAVVDQPEVEKVEVLSELPPELSPGAKDETELERGGDEVDLENVGVAIEETGQPELASPIEPQLQEEVDQVSGCVVTEEEAGTLVEVDPTTSGEVEKSEIVSVDETSSEKGVGSSRPEIVEIPEVGEKKIDFDSKTDVSGEKLSTSTIDSDGQRISEEFFDEKVSENLSDQIVDETKLLDNPENVNFKTENEVVEKSDHETKAPSVSRGSIPAPPPPPPPGFLPCLEVEAKKPERKSVDGGKKANLAEQVSKYNPFLRH